MARLHTAGFTESQDGAGTLQNIAALVDPYVPSLMPAEAGDFLKVDERTPLLIGFHAHVDATVQPRARLTQPSFRTRYGRTAIELPVLSSTAEPGSPHALNDFRGNPILLRGGERLGYETLNNPAGAVQQYGIGIFADAVPAPVSLQGAFCARFTSTSAAAVAATWNTRSLVSDEDLLEGEYEVLGGRALATEGVVARLSIPGQDARPPIACNDARTDVIHPLLQPGQLGVLGKFKSTNLPTVEFLADGTTTEVVVTDLWLRRVGAAAR